MDKKVALVTGANSGIGREIAIRLGALGYHTVINYCSNEEQSLEVKSVIEENGGTADIYKADVSKFEEVEKMTEYLKEKYERCDVLVNNAGITKDTLLLRMKEEDFDKVIEVNLKGTFNCTKLISAMMLKQKSGRIISMASVIGEIGNIGQANYAASKAGIIGLTKSVAKEVASRGITVNAIAPGFIRTKMTDVLSDKVKNEILNQIPLGRFGEASDIANLVEFLVSDSSRYITGQVINVDGGMVM